MCMDVMIRGQGCMLMCMEGMMRECATAETLFHVTDSDDERICDSSDPCACAWKAW